MNFCRRKIGESRSLKLVLSQLTLLRSVGSCCVNISFWLFSLFCICTPSHFYTVIFQKDTWQLQNLVKYANENTVDADETKELILESDTKVLEKHVVLLLSLVSVLQFETIRDTLTVYRLKKVKVIWYLKL